MRRLQYCSFIGVNAQRTWFFKLIKLGSKLYTNYEESKKAADAGVDAIIVQGREAGGHVIGQDGLITLLPIVVDLVRDRDITVIAAGGIVDERGYVAALALGAQGVSLGTRITSKSLDMNTNI